MLNVYWMEISTRTRNIRIKEIGRDKASTAVSTEKEVAEQC